MQSWDADGLWVKAKLFLNRALDTTPARTFDEQSLWASLALELLAKSVLARVSPLLIASPSEDGGNLLVASGLVEGDAHFTSVAAHTIFDRCAKAFPPFSAVESKKIAQARNEYLHGSGVGAVVIPATAWWPRFWALVAVLVNAADRDLAKLVGEDRVEVVEGYLAQNKKNVEHRTEMLVARAKQRHAQIDGGTAPPSLLREWDRPVDLRGYFSHSAEHVCPACGAEGVLQGDNVLSSEIRYEAYSDTDFDTWAELTVGSDRFSCQRCRLVLDQFDLISQAGLPEDFSDIGDTADYPEPEYGND